MSYDVLKAVSKSVWATQNQPQWGTTKKESYFSMLAKKNISPGPAARENGVEKIKKLSPSPNRPKRH